MPPKARYTRKRSRKSKNFVAIPVEGEVTIGTLAQNVVTSVGLVDSNLSEDLFVLSTDLTLLVKGATPGEGPLHVGIAHGDYGVTEILEHLDVDRANPGLKIEEERARRFIRKIGSFFHLLAAEILNNGMPIRTKCKFIVEDGKNLSLWVVNRGTGVTTGRVVSFSGYIYGKWLR